MYFANSIMLTMMITMCWMAVVTNGFTTNLPPRSTFFGVQTSAPVTTATSLFMNIESVKTKENIRVGVIGTWLLLNCYVSGGSNCRSLYVTCH